MDAPQQLHPFLTGVRLALFDIDGTLLRNGNRAHGISIVQACREITGFDVIPHLRAVDAGGRTDRYIVNELLRRCGLAEEALDAAFTAIAERSVELTSSALAHEDPGWVLEGARPLIGAMQAGSVALGLVTGNLPDIARIKLHCALLWSPFEQQRPLVAGFGDLSENRDDLAVAARNAALTHGLIAPADPGAVVVVGDTPRDIDCALAIGARCVAVATGRFTIEDLRGYADSLHLDGTRFLAVEALVSLCG